MLMQTIKEFGAVAGFKVNKQKTKILTKDMNTQEKKKLIEKTSVHFIII